MTIGACILAGGWMTLGSVHGTEQGLEAVFADFPKAFWYAEDAGQKRKGDFINHGHPYSEMDRWEIDHFQSETRTSGTTIYFRMKPVPEDRENYYHEFQFRLTAEGCETLGAWYVLPDGQRTTSIAFKRLWPHFAKEAWNLALATGRYSPDHLRPHTFNPPPNRTLVGQDFSGSGFLFHWHNIPFVACSLHQFNDAIPRYFRRNIDSEEILEVGDRLHDQEDLQVLGLQGSDTEAASIEYSSKHQMKEGDPVFLLDDATWRKGHLVAMGGDDLKLWFDEPFEGRGTSGAPVICGTTGNLLGVVTGGDNPDRTRAVTAERLKLPVRILTHRSTKPPPAFFGLQPRRPLPAEWLDARQAAAIFPASFAHPLGGRIDQLQADHPDVYFHEYDRCFTEPIPHSCLFSAFQLWAKDGVLTSVDAGSLRSATRSEALLLLAYCTAHLGEPQEVMEQDFDRQVDGPDYRAYYWTDETRTTVLSFRGQSSWRRLTVYLRIVNKPKPLSKLVNTVDATPLDVTTSSDPTELAAWLDRLEAIIGFEENRAHRPLPSMDGKGQK